MPKHITSNDVGSGANKIPQIDGTNVLPIDANIALAFGSSGATSRSISAFTGFGAGKSVGYFFGDGE